MKAQLRSMGIGLASAAWLILVIGGLALAQSPAPSSSVLPAPRADGALNISEKIQP